MKRIVIFLSALFLLLLPANAQTDAATAAKQINSIKMSSDYISAESTATTEQEAKDNARLLLEVNIEEWIKSKQSDAKDIQGYVAKSGNSILEVKTTRGNRFRVFLYVKKNNIMTFSDATEIIAAPMQQEAQQTIITTTAVEDLQQEIITKTDAKEEKPAVKEEKPAAKKEKAAKADKKAKSSKSKKEESVNEDEDDASNSPATEAVSAIETEVLQAAAYTPSAEERKMIAVTKFDEIKPFITNSPGLRDFGKFADMPAMGKCYLFVYDREGAVRVCLQRDDNGYTNVMNGAKDNIDNYKGCGAIWFRYNN